MSKAAKTTGTSLLPDAGDDPRFMGEQAFWKRIPGWESPAHLSGPALANWRTGYTQAHNEAIRALSETTAERGHALTRWRAMARTARVLRRIVSDAPPKSASLRMEARAALQDATTALIGAPPEIQSEMGRAP